MFIFVLLSLSSTKTYKCKMRDTTDCRFWPDIIKIIKSSVCININVNKKKTER